MTLSDNDDNDHRIPEDIEGRMTRRRSRDEDAFMRMSMKDMGIDGTRR